MASPRLFFRGGSIRNINYTKFKTKKNLNISKSPKKKKKKKTEIHKVLQLLSTMFHILKLLNDFFIINPTSYIFFNVHSQAITHPLISHWSNGLIIFFPDFKSYWFVIEFLFIFVFKNARILLRLSYSNLF